MRRRLRADRSGRGAWSDVVFVLAALFFIVAIVAFALLALAPIGVVTPGSWNPVLLPLAGVFGFVLVGIAIYMRRGERGSSGRR